MVFGMLCIATLSLSPGTQQLSTTLQLSTPQMSSSARKPQLVAARSNGRHELSRPRHKQLTVLAVAFALCNDVLLLLMLVPMLPFLLPSGATSQFALSCDSPNIIALAQHFAQNLAQHLATLHVHRMHAACPPRAHCMCTACTLRMHMASLGASSRRKTRASCCARRSWAH